ncbi:MAG TPA: TRAP transporter substrate-binding protein [Candidatus Tectomicrobia bacterium]|nr:TRAP transporter substrate-binding protein [Candidatus Tectomicrobia bacterium]
MTPTKRSVLVWLAFAMPVLVLAAAVWREPTPAAAQQRFVWKVQSAWPASNLLHISAVELARIIEEMSGGRLRWEMMAAGTVVGSFEVLDAVNRGLIDASHAWPGYWAGKNSAAGLFAPGPAGPFGMDREEYLSWLYAGGGLELYNELLQKELKMNVVVPAFTTSLPYWEPLGWFKRPFANLDELRKMKFRTSGLGMEMLRTMGMTVVSLPGGEVIPALERGAIDGAEWAIPSHDVLMGFQNVAKHYYMPDLRQPASYQEILVNRRKWDELPKDLQAIVKYASYAEIIRMTAYSVDLDSRAAEEVEKKHGVQIRRTPDEVLRQQVAALDKVYEAEAQKNPFFARVLKSQKEFAERAVPHAQRIRPPIEMIVQHYWKK